MAAHFFHFVPGAGQRARPGEPVTTTTNLVTVTTNVVTVTSNVVTTTTNLITTTANVVTTTTNVLAETTNQFVDATNAITDTADLIIYNAKVVTVNSDFAVDQAIAVRDGWILAVGKDRHMEQFRGPETLMIDAQGRMVMPGLYDAHVNSYVAAVSELNGPLPRRIPSKRRRITSANGRPEQRREPGSSWNSCIPRG